MPAGFAVLGVILRRSLYQLRQWIGGTRSINCLISMRGFIDNFMSRSRLMMPELILRLGAYSNYIAPDSNMKHGSIVTNYFAVFRI